MSLGCVLQKRETNRVLTSLSSIHVLCLYSVWTLWVIHIFHRVPNPPWWPQPVQTPVQHPVAVTLRLPDIFTSPNSLLGTALINGRHTLNQPLRVSRKTSRLHLLHILTIICSQVSKIIQTIWNNIVEFPYVSVRGGASRNWTILARFTFHACVYHWGDFFLLKLFIELYLLLPSVRDRSVYYLVISML